MPSLSIVIPVYQAEEYLAGCLDTIVGGGDQLEVVISDDCSPDASRAIADRYAEGDPRIRVVSTPENAGSGPARNHGLTHATGDYVWFVDADDELKPGAVDRVIAAVTADGEKPDVVLVQHEKVRDTGAVEAGELADLAGRSPVDPAGFTLEEWPRIIDYTHTPWTKVSRREFLTSIDLDFPSGWYTDIPWTYGLFRRAKRMALVTECCYQWIQRAGSSITRTRDDRHFDVFTQWQRVWDDFESVEDPGVRVALFNHMVWHLLLVIGNTERVDPKKRREFFRRTSDLYRRYHPGPDAWRPARGADGLKQRLLAARAYLGYEALRKAWRLSQSAKRKLKRSDPSAPAEDPSQDSTRPPAQSVGSSAHISNS
ncbi:glycosyltransferase [Glycomyces sp. L485]|uniref:glycosyltransferase family 2 protein n=1 Tax=Glycomyces sp. L485 TaxID=2909235 RepID=UPI001F4B3E96|nr:glycosyltransferase family 2 protein [Glycomyces sp. L485]MCH7232143.1 glycosyltransferase [Glycomyces sp. L485]